MSTEHLKLDSDEVVLKVVRKHWFILFSQVFLFSVAAITPIIFMFVLVSGEFIQAIPIPEGVLGPTAAFFSAAWFLVMWMMIFSAWTDYYLDIWTITNRRVVAIDQRGLFHRSISSFRLERLQDLNVHINGIIATALNFGTLEAETASGDENFVIHGVPKPRDIKALIQESADDLIVRPRPSDSDTASPTTGAL